MKYLYTISLFFICVSFEVFAVPAAPLFHINLDNGFPSNNVYSVIQDEHGYLWFATDNGVVKYNGYTFKIFNRSNGLPSSDVYQLYEDKKGRVWVYTLSYQFGYIQDDKYTNITLNGLDKTLHVRDMADNGRFLFFCFWEHNHYSMAIVKNDLVTTLPLYYPIEADSNTGTGAVPRISFCMISPNCKMWFLGYDNGLYVCDLLNPGKGYKKICTVDKFNIKYRNDNSVSIADRYDNILYFNYKDSRILRINTSDCAYEYLPFNNSDGEYIYTILNEARSKNKQEKNFVITNSSLYTLDTDYRVIARENLEDLVKTRSQVSFVFNDEWQNTWYSTTSDGVWCSYKQYGVFRNNDSTDLLCNSKYVGGSPGKNIYWWDKAQAILYDVSANDNIRKVPFSAKSGLKYVSPYTDSVAYLALIDGIFMYNWHTGALNSITKDVRRTLVYRPGTQNAQLITSDTLEKIAFGNHYLLQSFDSGTFFSTGAFGLQIFRKYGRDSLVCRVLSSERYTHIFVDSFSKNVIAYNYQKIFIYHPESGKYMIIDAGDLSRMGINNVANIEVDKYHDIYIEDDGRIVLFNPLLGRGAILTCPFNLLDATFHICNGQILVAGKFGMAIAPILGTLSVGKFKVVPNINFYYYNRVYDFVINNQNEIMLNTDKGFYIMRLGEIMQKKDFLIPSSSDFFAIVLRSPGERTLSDNDTITLDPKLDKINLDAINFYGRGSLSFSYFVEGDSKAWQQSAGEIFVSNLAPGSYYKVHCLVSDEMWRSRVVTFYLYRSPYWWQTPAWGLAFWIGGIALVIVLLLLVILATRSVVARSNEKKRALIELELRAIYAQINPHFIFNTLSAAQFFINKKRFDDAYVHVNKFSQLLRAYLKSSQDRYVTLDDEVQMLRNYIELQQIRFEEKFDYKVEIENKIPAHSVQIPSLLLQPLIENAINHGLFHRESGGLLLIKFLQGKKTGELICIIEDNGIGRHRAREINRVERTGKVSYGTKLTRQLIDIYREYEHMDISMEYIDKHGTETGTIVKLVIKKVKYIA